MQAIRFCSESVSAKIRTGLSVPVTGIEAVALDAVQQRMDRVEDRFSFVSLRNLVGFIPTGTGLEPGLGDQAEVPLLLRPRWSWSHRIMALTVSPPFRSKEQDGRRRETAEDCHGSRN